MGLCEGKERVEDEDDDEGEELLMGWKTRLVGLKICESTESHVVSLHSVS